MGLSNNAISYGTFTVVLAALDVPWRAGLAQMAAYATGTAWSFYWNRRWTFRRTDAPPAGQALRFVTVQVVLALASSGALVAAIERAGWPATPSWFAVMIVATVASFLASRFWVFR